MSDRRATEAEIEAASLAIRAELLVLPGAERWPPLQVAVHSRPRCSSPPPLGSTRSAGRRFSPGGFSPGITRQSAGSARYDAANLAVRAKLLACRGSQLCNAPGCMVITQGGQDGTDRDREVVHPELWWQS